MEYEVRFYYESEELQNILKGLKGESGLKEQPRTYEKTIQYNHSDERFDFYSKEIDGRFRLRISANDNETKCKLSWKRRLKATTETEVNKEEEKEVRINPNDIDNFLVPHSVHSSLLIQNQFFYSFLLSVLKYYIIYYL